MRGLFFHSLDILEDVEKECESIMGEAMPILFFGDIEGARIATLGLNPSDREFLDSSGRELIGIERRFATLDCFEADDWKGISDEDADLALSYCFNYFNNNPYGQWFNPLNKMISLSGFSYYKDIIYRNACHLDLVPFATSKKWGSMRNEEQQYLFRKSASILGGIVRDSSVEVLLLNGRSVISGFAKISNADFAEEVVGSWELRRKEKSIDGISFMSEVTEIGGVSLNKKIYALGYNHNIQSSFGITLKVKDSIANWFKSKLKEMDNDMG